MVRNITECSYAANKDLIEREETDDAGKRQIHGWTKSLGGQMVIRFRIHVGQREEKHLPVGEEEHTGSEQQGW